MLIVVWLFCRSQTIGYPTDLQFDENHVYLNMTGAACGCGSGLASAEIHFRCDPSKIGSPVLVENDGNCSFVFDWETSAACPIVASNGSSCVVTDSDTGDVYDFTPLMQDSDYTYARDI